MMETHFPLMDDWPFPLFKLDEGDLVIWTNQASQEWLGKSLRQMEGEIIWDILNTDPDTRGITAKSRDASSAITARHILVKTSKDAEEGRLAHLTAYPSQGGIGLSIWFVGREPRSTKIGGNIVTGF